MSIMSNTSSALIGIDGVGIGFDFCEYLFEQLPESVRKELEAKLTTPHFIPDLTNHSHARNLTRKLIERGFSDADIEKTSARKLDADFRRNVVAALYERRPAVIDRRYS